MHPSLEYALVGLIATIGTYLCTPLARQIATRWGAVAKPRDRDVHAVDTPRLGGLALLAGFSAAMVIAHALPTLHGTFRNGSEITGVLCGGIIICGLGVLDDRYELDSLTKFAGQVTAAAVMSIVGGIQLLYIYVPWGNVGTIPLDRDASVELTILLTVLTINAVNFIDGLDGLAAGVTAIQGMAFFGYSYHLAQVGNTDIALAPTLICAGLTGACIGFLPHNFSPARIFMGDSGSMLVGLILSAGATTASSQADPQSLGLGLKGALPLYLPLILPFAVLALPLFDLLLAVIRRLRRGQSPFAPDKEHLHHRLMDLGHSHRRAVLLLYFWSAVLAFGAVAMSISKGPWLVLAVVAGLLGAGLLATAIPRLRSARL
ncbi:glycosyltransferase family 4 protein [Jatrophihabitans lederbergiae]|uniref:MraY family glycosyltransferase n=1 Tax=Jatrophihabitans lederbergiae TaxID=3075547 RepID=A0ABU2J5J3_9ACTN|nr:MraY family glycosyltransferase [Jatrophihabitans sp. DSM 44399]MDT0259789.1 MraY family glycosyltransferase [Jatrophihabitans sp. DSM 44399]